MNVSLLPSGTASSAGTAGATRPAGCAAIAACVPALGGGAAPCFAHPIMQRSTAIDRIETSLSWDSLYECQAGHVLAPCQLLRAPTRCGHGDRDPGHRGGPVDMAHRSPELEARVRLAAGGDLGVPGVGRRANPDRSARPA